MDDQGLCGEEENDWEDSELMEEASQIQTEFDCMDILQPSKVDKVYVLVAEPAPFNVCMSRAIPYTIFYFFGFEEGQGEWCLAVEDAFFFGSLGEAAEALINLPAKLKVEVMETSFRD